MLQAVAAGWHHKTPEQLQHIANTVGKKRIMVVHGTGDRMLTFPLGVVLWRGLERGEGVTGKENWLGIEDEEDVWREGEVEKHFIRGQGHVLPAEMREEFQAWVEGLVERGIRMNAEEDV
jgi:predicted esterase